jgi:hypothetical protein
VPPSLQREVMSGPKVVRVRTREEREAECLSAIDNLRVAVEQCNAYAEQHDDSRSTDRMRKRASLLDDLTQKTRAGHFDSVLQICAQTLAEVSFERQELEREVLERAASEAARRRRTTFLAQALAQRLKARGLSVPPELSIALELTSNDADLEAAERVVSQFLSQHIEATAQSAAAGPTETQRKLADALGGNSKVPSLEEWASREAAEKAGTPGDRLERLIAEVSRIDASEVGRQLLARARAARSELDAGLRTRKVDSLLLEWAERRRAIAAADQLAANARRTELALQRVDQDEARLLAQRIASVMAAGGRPLETAVSQAQGYLVIQNRALVAAQRRNAVLSGLSSLGYEIGTELITATPAAGRIVVRRPDRPAYGIELMVPEGAERLQVKVVAVTGSGTPRDTSRDRDAETTWCSEFAKLQALLRNKGSDLTIERALGVGVVPLAEVSSSEADDSARDVADVTRHRTLDRPK